MLVKIPQNSLFDNYYVFFSYEVIDGNEIVYRDYVDISVAVAAPKVIQQNEKEKGSQKKRIFIQGLVVPVLRNVEKMSFADVERTISEFGEKVNENLVFFNQKKICSVFIGEKRFTRS